ncbi:Polyphosphate glucokinase [Lacunisphaera limnophila]|uniref:Polyphosphate glucokinase n=1 Tax=Lacunisphaera limnophila TaxID=1838286 RepID=A0A1D8AVX5_9BACT|nr:ROK family protein [Lacunisphaera limnophila]AOS45031.1 Polyphosphate glucokinase [Lacunisphaera limnophila]
MKVLGIDIGGSAFKGAPVDTKTGRLLAERHRVEIKSPCSLRAGVAAAREIARHFQWKGPVGIGFPGVIQDGRIGAVGNLGDVWVGQSGATLFRRATGCPVRLVNDADAAGLAEMRFGAGRGRKGTVILLTFGTGIGSALFYDGQLVPNAELGHIPWRGKPFERYAAASVRKRARLDWPEWAQRVNVYFATVERLFSPQLIIIGGGVSKKSDKFLKFIRAHARVVPARHQNDAGIVGAAMTWEQ